MSTFTVYAQRFPFFIGKVMGTWIAHLARVGVVSARHESDAITEGRKQFGVLWPVVERVGDVNDQQGSGSGGGSPTTH